MKTLFLQTKDKLRKVLHEKDLSVLAYLDYLKSFPTNKSVNHEPFKEECCDMRRYDGRKAQFKGVDAVEYAIAYEKKLYRSFYKNSPEIKHRYRRVFNEVKYNLTRPRDNYTKLPIIGNTYIYNASPIFGHRDYNKARLIEIKGNERFINWLFAYVEKKTGKQQPRVAVG